MRTLPSLAAVVTAAILTSCSAPQPELAAPQVVPERFSAAGEQRLSGPWWAAFADPQLDALVDQALAANFDLKTAWYRLREARAVLDRAGAARSPTVDGQLFGEVSRTDDDTSEQLLLGLAADYEVDLWGRIQSEVDAERFRTRASWHDYRTAALSLSAEVARTWLQLREARQQLQLLDEQLQANRKILRLIRARFGSGTVRSVDILRQQQLVEATREERIAARTRVALLEHLLAVLCGQPPTTPLTIAAGDLPDLPPLPQTGLPLDLVQRRPDIQRAYALLQAADRDLAAAISNRYPRLSLSLSAETRADETRALFDDWLTTLAGDLLAPLIDGGRRRAEVARNRAVVQQRLHRYAQVSLDAFREVEDALVRERQQQQRLASLAEQVRLAETTYAQLRIEYFNGLSDYIDVLVAQTALQQLRRDRLAGRRELLTVRVALYRALAGGVPEAESAEPLQTTSTVTGMP